MNFTTRVSIPNSQHPLDYNSKIVSLGSCFAVNMGEKLDYFKFDNTTNPFGIIFNPVSIEKLIVRSVNQKKFTEEDLFFHNERFHCYEVHSDLSSVNQQELLNSLNTSLEFTYKKIKTATHILITYGTSWVYQEKNSGAVVANCHKMPQSHFDKHLLSVATIEVAIQNTVDAIRKVNPNCSFVFTLSPVRHIKDGFVENQRSKAHLITALQSLLSDHLLDKAGYFPAYEIVMDELRDYRFYGDDLLHPSSMAIEYIWQRFRASSISETAWSTLDEVEAIQKSLLHKPFNPLAESHQKFQSKLQENISKLQERYPFMKF
jgi:GSCFA family